MDKLIHVSYIYIHKWITSEDTLHLKQLRTADLHRTLPHWGFMVTVQGSETVIDQDPTGGRLVRVSFLGFHSKSGGRKFSWPGNLRWKGHGFKSHTSMMLRKESGWWHTNIPVHCNMQAVKKLSINHGWHCNNDKYCVRKWCEDFTNVYEQNVKHELAKLSKWIEMSFLLKPQQKVPAMICKSMGSINMYWPRTSQSTIIYTYISCISLWSFPKSANCW